MQQGLLALISYLYNNPLYKNVALPEHDVLASMSGKDLTMLAQSQHSTVKGSLMQRARAISNAELAAGNMGGVNLSQYAQGYRSEGGVTFIDRSVHDYSSKTTAVQNENKTFATTPVGYDRLDQVMTTRMMRQYAGFRIGGRQY
jgi:hypothetical protein